MNIRCIVALAAAACFTLMHPAADAQTVSAEDQGPERILKMLTERERRFADGENAPTDLTSEELQHIDRILRLYKLELAKEAEFEPEPAGASVAAAPPTHKIEIEMEDLDHVQSEANVDALMREIANLRAEVMRLKIRLNAMEQTGGTFSEPLEEQEEVPRFYLPIR